MSDVLVLETAEREDLPALHDLERRCHTHPWNLRHFEAALRDGSTRVRVLRRRRAAPPADRGIEGFCVVQVAADEMHVHNLVVRPESRRLGLGRRLLDDALAWAAEAGVRQAFLEVRQSNWGALALYRAAGFDAVSVRKDYYDRPREDALVLRRELGSSHP
ncbi:MAG TPA: ribosomal protein S18-alanine N-acetyltransferase [Vicinamibacteria bacterium]|nr:ribosomal protein S18-alanine N-acetyltransferase [Vicinamibacteria bacterium]